MSNFKIIFDITKTHLVSRYKQSLIAALGVTFGIGAYIFLMGFMTGLNNMLDGLILNRTPHIHLFNEIKPTASQPINQTVDYLDAFNIVHSVKPKDSKPNIHNAIPIIEKLKTDKRIKSVTPQVSAKVFYIAGSSDLNGMLTGINIEDEIEYYNFDQYIIEGNPLDLKKTKNGILIGAGIASKLSLSIGDRIQVGTVSGGNFSLKIVGIYQSGLADVDNITSFTTIHTSQKILGENNNFISDINIKLWDVEKAPEIAKEIESQFKITAVDINTANAQFDTGNEIRNLISYAVSLTLLLVAGFGIYNILNMMIYDKMDDIAILKATGFSGGDVEKIFISQALLIGLIGGALGLLLGYLGCVVLSNTPFETPALPTIKTYPINFDPWTYIIGIIFALVSTFLAGYLPARKAKKIDPVEIIRGK